MPTARPRRAAAAPVASTKAVPAIKRRTEIIYKDINDLAPYDWNPRDNANAVKNVAASIAAFGFLVPCVIDNDNILIAGHTRVEAAKSLGIDEVPCIIASDLTPEEAIAFRLIDNKVSEQAKWDFELLAGEMQKLDGLGLDFTQFGWTSEEMDCLGSLVSADCLNPTNLEVTPPAGAEPTARRSPLQARFVLGELVFFIPAAQYRNWADGVRQLHNFDEEAIAEDLKRRLGILT
jgi:hypothetical protein